VSSRSTSICANRIYRYRCWHLARPDPCLDHRATSGEAEHGTSWADLETAAVTERWAILIPAREIRRETPEKRCGSGGKTLISRRSRSAAQRSRRQWRANRRPGRRARSHTIFRALSVGAEKPRRRFVATGVTSEILNECRHVCAARGLLSHARFRWLIGCMVLSTL